MMAPNTLLIRYGNPDTTPSRYPFHGWARALTVMEAPDVWTVVGPAWALKLHVEQAAADENVAAYGFEYRAAS